MFSGMVLLLSVLHFGVLVATSSIREPLKTNERWGTANKDCLSKRVIFLSVSVSLTWCYNYSWYAYFVINPWSAARTLL